MHASPEKSHRQKSTFCFAITLRNRAASRAASAAAIGLGPNATLTTSSDDMVDEMSAPFWRSRCDGSVASVVLSAVVAVPVVAALMTVTAVVVPVPVPVVSVPVPVPVAEAGIC